MSFVAYKLPPPLAVAFTNLTTQAEHALALTLAEFGLSFVSLTLYLGTTVLTLKSIDSLRHVDVRLVDTCHRRHASIFLLGLSVAAAVSASRPGTLAKIVCDGSLLDHVPRAVLLSVQLICLFAIQVGYLGRQPLRTIKRTISAVPSQIYGMLSAVFCMVSCNLFAIR